MSSRTSGSGPGSTASSPGSARSSSSSPPERAGRDGRLALAFERRAGGATALVERRFTLPLEALEPIDLDGALVVFVLNPTGGIVGGDRLEVEVEVREGAAAVLTTPSATRVYRTLGPAAVQRLRARVGRGAAFEWVPDHVIPSPGAALRSEVEVELGEGARAILWDALAAGRLARGERWRFALLEGATRVRDGRGVVFRESFRIEPARLEPARPGLAEDAGYLGTLAAFGEIRAEALAAAIQGLGPGVSGGASALARGGAVARVLAKTAPDLERARAVLWKVAREALLGKAPPDLRRV